MMILFSLVERNPCANNPCPRLCLLTPKSPGYTCLCPLSERYDVPSKTCMLDDRAFIMSVQKNSINGYNLDNGNPAESGTIGGMVPLPGLSNVYGVDYDEWNNNIYYVQQPVKGQILLTSLTKNAFVYKLSSDGLNSSILLPSAKPGDAYCIAFDWIGKNLYVGNKDSANIEVVRTASNNSVRAVILSNDNSQSGVVLPVAIALYPMKG